MIYEYFILHSKQMKPGLTFHHSERNVSESGDSYGKCEKMQRQDRDPHWRG